MKSALSSKTIAQRYELGSVLAAGGMGVAYLARDRATSNTVVVKLIRDVSAPEAELRFARECAALAAIEHGNVVTYIDHGADPNAGLFLVTEWVAGETLAQRLKRGELSLESALALGLGVASGLAYAHARSIVHRDVTPSNILLADGVESRPKLIDFGVATARSASDAQSERGQIVGTIAYMAPEQARSEPRIDARADVFALGAVLYRLVVREPIRDTSDPLRALARAANVAAPSVSAALGVPECVRAVIDRATAFDPSRRYRDGAELYAALAAALDELRENTLGAPSSSLASAQRAAMVSIVTSEDEATLDAIGRALRAVGAEVRRAQRSALVSLEDRAGTGAIEGAVELVRMACEQRGSTVRAAVRTFDPSTMSLDEAFARAEDELDAQSAVRSSPDRSSARAPLSHEAATVTARESAVRERAMLLRDELGVASAPRVAASELDARRSRFVGRDREIERVCRAWLEARASATRRSVLITAPAGLGKSRLSNELVRVLSAAHGASVTSLSALPERCDAPLWFARRLVGALDDRDDGDQLSRSALVTSLSRALASPRVLILDDLQWCDPASLAVIDGMLRGSSAGGSLLVAFARPELHSPSCPLRAARFNEQLTLSALDDGACTRLARAAAPTLAVDLLRVCVERAQGSPLRLLELVRSDAATIELAQRAPDFRALVGARLDALPLDARRVAVAIAALGLSCTVDEAAVAAACSEEEAERALLALVDVGWLRDQEGSYLFDHPTSREVAYGSASERERAETHRRIFDWLVREREDSAARIVAHGALAGLGDELVRYEAAWCRQLIDAGDFDEVLACARRSFARSGAHQVELDLLVAIAAPFSNAPRAGIDAALRCIAACDREDPRRWAAIAALFRNCHRTLDRAPIADAASWFEEADPRSAPVIEAALEWLYTIGPRGANDPRLLWISRARDLINAPLSLLALADAVEASIAFANANSVGAVAHWRRAREGMLAAGLYERAMIALANEANSYFSIGRADAVIPLIEPIVECAGALPPRCEAHLLCVLAFALNILGEHERAIERATVMSELCARSDDRRMRGEAELICAYAQLALGRATESVASARRAADAFTPAVDRYLIARVAEADAHAALGAHAAAMNALDEVQWERAISPGSEVDVAHYVVVACPLLIAEGQAALAEARYRFAAQDVEALAAPLDAEQRARFETTDVYARFYALGRARGWL